MSDFRVQYVSGTVPNGVTQYELLAPASFVPINALANAFIMPATTMPTVGIGAAGGSSQVRDWALNCDINSTTRILLNRGAGSGVCEFAFYIVEYIGVPGGPNEIVMRGKRIFPFNPDATLTADSNPISGITSLSRCVPFITGRHDGTGTAALRHFMAQAQVTSQGTDGVITLTRTLGTNGDPTYVCYCVEFTGSNWTVQTGAASNWTANTDKNTAITPVASTLRSWVHGYYIPGNRDTPAGGTWFAWLSSLGNLRTRTIDVSSISSLRFWIIQNSDVRFSTSITNAVNGSNDWLGGGASPQSQTVTVPLMSAAGVAVTGWAGSSGNNTNQNPAGVWRLSALSSTQVQAYRTNSTGNTEYILQVLNLPADTEASFVVTPTVAALPLTGAIPNAPAFRTPAPAQLTLQSLPQPASVVREPTRALLTLFGYQPVTTAVFPATAQLSWVNGLISDERTKVIVIPMPDLTYTETPNNAPTVIVGGGVAPATAVLVLQSLTLVAGEGGNITIRSPAPATLSFAGQLGAVALESATTGLLLVEGLTPTLEGTELLIEPGCGALTLTAPPLDPRFVFIPYQWIDVEPAPVVDWH
jgi:hypothetical protein